MFIASLIIGGIVLFFIGFIILHNSWSGVGTSIGVVTVLLGLFITIGGVTLIEEEEKSEELKACESIGGEFEVVDTEYSHSRKRTVNVYGCLK